MCLETIYGITHYAIDVGQEPSIQAELILCSSCALLRRAYATPTVKLVRSGMTDRSVVRWSYRGYARCNKAINGFRKRM
jgi:hypothetical protein